MNSQKNKEKIKKIKSQFYKRSMLLATLHVAWLFLSNLAIFLADELYFHNKSFVFFSCLGSTVVILTGLFSTIEELGKEALEKIKEAKNEKED